MSDVTMPDLLKPDVAYPYNAPEGHAMHHLTPGKEILFAINKSTISYKKKPR